MDDFGAQMLPIAGGGESYSSTNDESKNIILLLLFPPHNSQFSRNQIQRYTSGSNGSKYTFL